MPLDNTNAMITPSFVTSVAFSTLFKHEMRIYTHNIVHLSMSKFFIVLVI